MTNELIKHSDAWDLTPKTFSEALQVCELLAKSSMIPEQYRGKPGDVLIAIQYGIEVGLKPLQSLQGIAVINGRPTIWGDAALAVVLASGTMESYHEMTADEIRASGKAVFTGMRKGSSESITREFSLVQANQAGLTKKPGPWQQYTERMLQMRARSWALRDGWADILKGMQVREEIEDIIPSSASIETENRLLELKQRLLQSASIKAPEIETPKPTPKPPPVSSPELDFISYEQHKRFWALCRRAKIPNDEIKQYLEGKGYASSKDIKRSDYEAVCHWADGHDAKLPETAEPVKAEVPKSRLTVDQRKTLYNEIAESNAGTAEVLRIIGMYGFEQIHEITQTALEAIISDIKTCNQTKKESDNA